jgi:hypothetical protein
MQDTFKYHSISMSLIGQPTRKIAYLSIALTGFLTQGQSFAQDQSNNLLVYSAIGSGGIGLGLGKEMSNGFLIRGEVTNLNKSIQTNQDGINYSGNFNLSTTAVYADYSPWKSSFHLSTGINFKPTSVTLTANPTAGRLTLNGQSYPINSGQGITATISFPTTMPYLGMGWGFGNVASISGLRFSTDMGFDFGKMDGVIKATPGLSQLPGFSDNLSAQNQKLSTSVSALRFFPVIKFQVGYAY